jgi:uncharacterized HAD superfamily protein
MHLGIDLDNTILDATSAHLHYYNMVSAQKFSPEDVTDFYIYRIYGWDNAERDRVYHLYGHDIHWNSSPLPMAIEELQLLYNYHTISFITARPHIFSNITLDWLKHHNIRYHNIIFTEDKLRECNKLHVDLLIDDAPHYAEEFSRLNKPVILYDQPYNRNVNNEFVFRANNWTEVVKHIKDFECSSKKSGCII